MYFVINLIGVLVFLAVGVLLSKKRKDIHWRGVGSLLALNVFIAWFLISFPIGRDIVQGQPQASPGSSASPTRASPSRSRTGSTCRR